MSDNSLPKPASPTPSFQVKPAGSQPQMPPSARVSTPPPGLPVSSSPLKNPPQSVTPATLAPAVSPGQKQPLSPAQQSPPSSTTAQSSTPPPAQKSSAPPTLPQASTSAQPSTQSPAQSKPKSPQLAKIKKSPFRFLPFVIGGLILLAGIAFGVNKFWGHKTTPVEVKKTAKPKSAPTSNQNPSSTPPPAPAKTSLTYWGLWEPDTVIREVLNQFETDHPDVAVNYVKQSYQDYRARLQTAVASGNGPDVFRFHASWTPMLQAELAPMPVSVMSAAEYQQTFYPVAATMLSLKGQLMGVPLMYDGLGLYYNKEILTTANEQVPKTWAELKSLAAKLTVRSGNEIRRAGVALGNASNVEHFSDILGLLMLQNGADLTLPTSKEAQDALTFYTNFIKQDEVWSSQLPSSTVAFARGDVAMMLAPSWRAHEIKKMNPELSFGIAPVPTLGETKIAWASFWAEGVSSQSKNTTQAWELIKYLSSKEVQQQLFSAQSQIRNFGEIYSRTDLADELANNEYVQPYLQDAPYAQSWYLNSYTHDNGVNDLLIKYYEDAINSVLAGTSVDEALQVVAQGTTQVLRQYAVK